MKAVIVAVFAVLAVASAVSPIPPQDAAKQLPPAPAPAPKGDLQGAEAVYVASPYVASYPAYSAYSAPAYSAYSYQVPAATNYGYAAAPYAYLYR